jgi:hypothetical protein
MLWSSFALHFAYLVELNIGGDLWLGKCHDPIQIHSKTIVLCVTWGHHYLVRGLPTGQWLVGALSVFKFRQICLSHGTPYILNFEPFRTI